ncbi:hypothetical protein [Macrococcoides caseolyticum]|uniref:hypothetical protein n=1 Tax=Macrococcoides caseolyticum TaxID=69966 RepID=UPI001F311E0B|nr:hypothetical protein [Macrococcus caseolyticus]MCE4956064.1 hypothetical protein [Macrococcus caseolyticus]
MKLANILIGFFALLFFAVQLFNLYDGLINQQPEVMVSALYFISIGLFMLFNLHNALLTQSDKVITPKMQQQQLIVAVALFIFAFAVLIGLLVYNLGILSKLVQLMILVSIFFEIRSRTTHLKQNKR